MSDERKKAHVWPWIVALLIALPVLYVASFGPACWLASRTRIGQSAIPVIYRPMTALMVIDDSPAEVKRRVGAPSASTSAGGYTYVVKMNAIFFYSRGYVSKYAILGAADNWKWRFEVPVEHSPDPVARMDEGRWEWFRDGP